MMNSTPGIAHTTVGRNALFCGLIGHIAALLAGMLTASGAEAFFRVAFPLSWIALTAGAYAELHYRGVAPLRATRFYLLAVAGALPVMGPLVVLWAIYTAPRQGQELPGRMAGLFPAILRLRANLLLVAILILLLFLLFAFTTSQNDPYFQRRPLKSLSLQSSWTGDRYGNAFRPNTRRQDERRC